MTPTILVVEDDRFVMRVARTVLGRDGYRVLEATTAEEAFTVADGYGGPIHLLITNNVLQNVRGRDIGERLKLAHPEMKILHISGHLLQTLQQNDSLTPGSAFLQKPFLPKTLAETVRTLLAERSDADAL